MFDKTKKSAHLVGQEFLKVFDFLSDLDIDLTDESLEQMRLAMAQQFSGDPSAVPEPLQAVSCDEVFVPSLFGSHDVPVLVYQPPGVCPQKPAIINIHGGGYVMGSPEIMDLGSRALALEHQCCVVSVRYRLAPETQYPGAVEDCYSAFAWAHKNAEALDLDTNKIAIMGGSAGGGHAAALAIMVRDRNEYPCCLLAMDSPMLDDRTGSTHEPHPYAGEYIWTAQNNRYGWRSLLGVEPGSDQVPDNAVPARVEDLIGLPATYIAVGSLDLFIDESLEFARRLMRAGVPIEVHVIPGAVHGYQGAGLESPQVKASMEWSNAALTRAWR